MAPSMAQSLGQVDHFNALVHTSATFSYLVGIRSSADSANECAGVLIAKNASNGTDKHYASIGSRYNSGEREGERIRIANWTRHPDYNGNTSEFNCILFTLATESTYEPIALPAFTGVSVPVGSSAIAIGWTNNETWAEQKNVKIITAAECKETQTVHSSELCAHDAKATDACSLNKGSPLVVTQSDKEMLVGLVNVNNGCNKTRIPTVFNRVTKIRSWIKQIANV